MTMMNVAPLSKFAQLRRRHRSVNRVAHDINADFSGRRPTGDPRLDLAAFDRV